MIVPILLRASGTAGRGDREIQVTDQGRSCQNEDQASRDAQEGEGGDLDLALQLEQIGSRKPPLGRGILGPEVSL